MRPHEIYELFKLKLVELGSKRYWLCGKYEAARPKTNSSYDWRRIIHCHVQALLNNPIGLCLPCHRYSLVRNLTFTTPPEHEHHNKTMHVPTG